MPPEDPTTYYTLIATILLGVVLFTVLELREMAKSTRQGADTLVQRASFLTYAVVAFTAVAALSEIPSVARGETSWLTHSRAELIAILLLGVSIAAPIMAYGSAAFSRRPRPSSKANSDDSAAPNPPVERQPVARWLVVLLVLLAVGRRR